MCACDNRQLTQAQREAGFDQLRNAGVMQAVRPFSGSPTLPNLIDYVNRELFPAVKQSRNKVNDVYRQVTDNAPSANPLAYYFSTETANADPTVGRVRLDNATQDSATTVRVSQTNARLKDVAAWLDVMAGSATAPLGTLTLSDYADPNRFVRFDLNTMVDQGSYWDLGVTPIESSHDNPFVEDEGIVIAFIPGVASSGATVPPGAITPIPTDTFVGNISGSTAAPVAVPLADIDSASIVYDATSHTFQRAALTGGDISASQNSNALTIDNNAVTNAKLRDSAAVSVIGRNSSTSGDPADIVSPAGNRYFQSSSANTLIGFFTPNIAHFPTINDNRFIGNISGATAVMSSNDIAGLASDGTGGIGWNPTTHHFELFNILDDRFIGNISGATATPTPTPFASLNSTTIIYENTGKTFIRQALTGDVTAPQNSNTTTISNDAVTDAKLRDSVALSVIGRSANSTGNPGDISTTASSGAVLRESGGVLGFGTVGTAGLADDSVTNAILAEMAANTVKANATAGTANPTDVAVGTNTVLGRVGANIVAAQVVAAQIADDNVTDGKLRNSNACSVIGRETNSSGDPADILATTNDRVLARSSDSVAFQLITSAMIAAGTIALDRITGINANTVIGNDTASATNPVEIAIGTNTVLGRVAGNIVAAQVVGAQIAANTVANGNLTNMAQSRIKGRAEGAGTGDPTDLTPTQVMSIVDAENVAWTGNHSFTAATFTTDVTGAHSMESDGDMGIASVSGGLALGAGNVIVSPSVGNGDVVVNATGGVAITAGGSPISDATANDIVLQAADDVRLEATDQLLVTADSVEVAAPLGGVAVDGTLTLSRGVNPGQIVMEDGDGESLTILPANITGATEPELWMNAIAGLEPINNICRDASADFSTTRTNTTATVSLVDSIGSVPGGSWCEGRTYTVVAHIIVQRGATVTASNLRVTFGLSGGFTDTFDLPVTALPLTTSTYRVECILTCISTGSSGSFFQSVRLMGAENANAFMLIQGGTDLSPHTVDTTTGQTITATANMTVAVANLSMTRTVGYMTRTF